MDSVILLCSFALSCTPKQSEHFPDSFVFSRYSGHVWSALALVLTLGSKVQRLYRNCK